MVNRLSEYRRCERERDRLSAQFDAIYAAAERGRRGFNATERVQLGAIDALTEQNARSFRAVNRAIDAAASERARTPPPQKHSRTREPSPELWAGAIHEAAHIVVAHTRGGRTDFASLRPTGAGSVSVSPDGPTRVAGIIGEQMSGCQSAAPWAAAERDMSRALELARTEAAKQARYNIESRATALVEKWQHEARAILQARLSDVVSLAHELNARHTLRAADIDAFFALRESRRPVPRF